MSSAADKAETNKIAIKTAKDEETESPIDKVGADDEDRALIRSFAPQGLGDFGGGGGAGGATKPQHEFKHISKWCTYVLRHDKSISDGDDIGVATSVMFHELRIGAGGDSFRPYVHTANKLIKMLHKGSNTARFKVVYFDGG